MIFKTLLLAVFALTISACNRTEGPATDNKEMSNTAPGSVTGSKPKDDSISATTTNTDSGSHEEKQPAPARTPAPQGTPGEAPLPKKSTKMK